MDREQAVDTFLRALINDVYKSGIRISVSFLSEKPPGSSPAKERLERFAWYQKLAEADQLMVQDVISDTAKTTVFRLLCLLDGVNGGSYTTNSRSEFVLHLNGYEDEDAYWKEVEFNSTRTNSKNSDWDLHDLFKALINEAATNS